jgi:GT2 family glycosyltransferase
MAMREKLRPVVSVAIVNWNTRELLRSCLASLPYDSPRVSVEAIVVDNGSADGSAQMVRENFPQAVLVENDSNVGFVRATNQALGRASGDFLFMLNSDTEVREGCIERLVEVAAADETIGAVGPRLLNPDGTPQRSFGPFPHLVHRLVPSRFEDVYARRVEKTLAASPDGTAPVDWLGGAALLFRRDVLEKVGALDERYFMWYEDLDWCQKLRRAGYKRILVGDAYVVHHGRQSGRKLSDRELATQLLDSEYTYLRLNGGRASAAAVFAMRVGKALLMRAFGNGQARAEAAFRLSYHRSRLWRFCVGAMPRGGQ